MWLFVLVLILVWLLLRKWSLEKRIIEAQEESRAAHQEVERLYGSGEPMAIIRAQERSRRASERARRLYSQKI
jgi:hypothetical protein